MLQAQAASDQVAIVNAQNAIQIGYNTLMNLMQYPLDTPLKIQPMDIATLPETPLENVSENIHPSTEQYARSTTSRVADSPKYVRRENSRS